MGPYHLLLNYSSKQILRVERGRVSNLCAHQISLDSSKFIVTQVELISWKTKQKSGTWERDLWGVER